MQKKGDMVQDYCMPMNRVISHREIQISIAQNECYTTDWDAKKRKGKNLYNTFSF